MVELCGAPPFDERRRGDPAATRAYRAMLADDAAAACAWLESDAGRFEADEIDLSNPCRPRWRGRLGPCAVEATASADREGVLLRWRLLLASGPECPPIRLRVRGRVDRPALAEITEIDPPPPTGAATRLTARGSRLELAAPELPAAALIVAEPGPWRLDGEAAVLEIAWPRGERERAVSLHCRFEPAPEPGPPPCPVRWPPPATGSRRLVVTAARAPLVERIGRRAIAYVRGCTALATGGDERALLADHRLLPLSWTRDAYWQALLLLATGQDADLARVADHLRWLWRRCERPAGRWVRSHHVDGRRKDTAFQADQQLYPLIELADWWRAAGRLPHGVAWATAVPRAWEAALAALDRATGLIWSGENAADDPAEAPYIASAQVLLWYAARRLAELATHEPIGLAPDALREAAAGSRAAFDRHLVADGMWAYATDGAGGAVAYHDANDLPTALAPLLGFCASDDAAWRATMDFAFSPANPGAADAGGGLGSAHTAGAWTLGDVQAWVVASLSGDEPAAAAALDRLAAAAFADGMLPEAYAAGPAGVERVRHWFAWPGAALGALALLDTRGLLEARIGVASAG